MGYRLQGRFYKRRVRWYTVSSEEYNRLSKTGNTLPEGSSAQDALMFVAVNARDLPVPVTDMRGPAAPKPSPRFQVEQDAQGNWRVVTSLE